MLTVEQAIAAVNRNKRLTPETLDAIVAVIRDNVTEDAR